MSGKAKHVIVLADNLSRLQKKFPNLNWSRQLLIELFFFFHFIL